MLRNNTGYRTSEISMVVISHPLHPPNRACSTRSACDLRDGITPTSESVPMNAPLLLTRPPRLAISPAHPKSCPDRLFSPRTEPFPHIWSPVWPSSALSPLRFVSH